MPRRNYLRSTQGRRVFRRALPADLVERFGKVEFICCLGSVPFDEAQRQARALAVTTDGLMSMARRNPTLTEDDLDRMATDAFADVIATRKRANELLPIVDAHGKSVPNPSKRRYTEQVRTHWENEKKTAQEFAANDLWEPFAEDAASILRKHGAIFEEGDTLHRDMARRVARLYSGTIEIEAGEAAGDFGVEPKDPLVRNAPRRVSRLPMLSAAAKIHHERKLKDGRSSDKDGRALNDAVGLLIRWHGDRRIDRYRREDFVDFIDMLRTLPKHHGKSEESRTNDLEKIIADADARNLPRLKPPTVFKHYTQLQALFDAFTNEGQIEKNPVKGLFQKPAKLERAKDNTRTWKDAEIAKLFGSPVWMGMRNPTHKATPGELIVRDAAYWAPLLLAFHGARLNEICQLMSTDIKAENGIPYLYVTDAPDEDEEATTKDKLPAKRLKNLSSRRKIPLHSAVLKLGFLEYVQASKSNKEQRLFPELPISKRSLFSAAISKWFSRAGGYRDKINLSRDLKLHGLRSTVISKLAHAGINREVINQIVGHSGRGIGETVYTDDYPLSTLRDAIEKIEYPGLDLDRLRKLADDAAE